MKMDTLVIVHVAALCLSVATVASAAPIHTAVQQDDVEEIREILKENPKAVDAKKVEAKLRIAPCSRKLAMSTFSSVSVRPR